MTKFENPMNDLFEPSMPLQITTENTALLVVDMQYFDAHPDWGEGRTAKELGVAHHFQEYFDQIEAVTPQIQQLLGLFRRKEMDVIQFENKSMARIGLIPEITSRYRSPYFGHIFSGGYSSGYYSYIWAEVLDADAYEAFRETSIFDAETAKLFRDNIMARGGTEDPMTLYLRFRGAEPSVEPLLKNRGLQ